MLLVDRANDTRRLCSQETKGLRKYITVTIDEFKSLGEDEQAFVIDIDSMTNSR